MARTLELARAPSTRVSRCSVKACFSWDFYSSPCLAVGVADTTGSRRMGIVLAPGFVIALGLAGLPLTVAPWRSWLSRIRWDTASRGRSRPYRPPELHFSCSTFCTDSPPPRRRTPPRCRRPGSWCPGCRWRSPRRGPLDTAPYSSGRGNAGRELISSSIHSRKHCCRLRSDISALSISGRQSREDRTV